MNNNREPKQNMQPPFKKTSLAVLMIVMLAMGTKAQTEFFRSKQVYTEEQLDQLYASIALHDSLLIFNAPDYTLYAYNKKDGSLKWSSYTSYKTSVPVFIEGNRVYAGLYADKKEQAAIFNIETGKLERKLPFGPLATKPLIKNNMLYGTAIYNFGSIVGYDIIKDSVTWSYFIAHGYSTQPYFFNDKIIANGEGSNWIEIAYDGSLIDTTCADRNEEYGPYTPCIKRFKSLTHDRRELTDKLAHEILGEDHSGTPAMLTTGNRSFIFDDGKLTVMGDKLKKKYAVDINDLVTEEPKYNSKTKMLAADNENIWLLYRNHVLQYAHAKKKLVRSVDLDAWQPEKLLLDGNDVWLVSGKDGLVYGLHL